MTLAEEFDIDPSVIVGIAFVESHWGYDQRNTGTRNAFGLLRSDGSHYVYDNWEDSIRAAFRTVEQMRNHNPNGQNRLTVAGLYDGGRGAYCAHPGCNPTVVENHTRQLFGVPSRLTFRCKREGERLVRKADGDWQ